MNDNLKRHHDELLPSKYLKLFPDISTDTRENANKSCPAYQIRLRRSYEACRVNASRRSCLRGNCSFNDKVILGLNHDQSSKPQSVIVQLPGSEAEGKGS